MQHGDVTWRRVRTPTRCPHCDAKVIGREHDGACRHFIGDVKLGDALGLARAWPATLTEELVLQSHLEYTGGPRDRWIAFRIPGRR